MPGYETEHGPVDNQGRYIGVDHTHEKPPLGQIQGATQMTKPKTSAEGTENVDAVETPVATTPQVDSATEKKPDYYVVLPTTMWHYSRGDLIDVNTLPFAVEKYLEQGSLVKATKEDVEAGTYTGKPEDLPDYPEYGTLSIPKEAYAQLKKTENLAPALPKLGERK